MEPPELSWVKAEKSAGLHACVELAVDDDAILLRDSKSPGVCLRFSKLEIEAFLDGVKRSEFDHLVDRPN